MSTSAVAAPAVHTAFEALIDYAGLFPPAALDMRAAAVEYAGLRSDPAAWMLGRFVVPAGALDGLAAEAETLEGAAPFELSVIAGTGATARTFVDVTAAAFERIGAIPAGAMLVVRSLEIVLPRLEAARDTYASAVSQLAALLSKHGLRNVPAFVEIPQDDRFDGELIAFAGALARAKLGGKLRCGGVTAGAFPPPERVAAFIHAMTAESVAFKCTAGLHHPIRHAETATGFEMHGFLNVLAAAALAGSLDEHALAGVLREESSGAFRFDDDALYYSGRLISLDELKAARARFVAYGSCSFREPVDDLRAMGVLK